uniref:Telomere repeat binding bouquet formation protein 2 n=1 Tax=Neogobius melanostomus TaxID=47308 RepID=A0A8C6S905_9GOBI
MFHDKTAWFSSSVAQECKTFWVMEGGTITSWKTADYLFSQDASCPDTKRIYCCRDYLFNKVTVFHSFFLSTCEKRQSYQSVCIGHYVLPPESVQEEVRSVIGRLIWECDDVYWPDSFSDESPDKLSVGEASLVNSIESDTSVNGLRCGVYPSNNMLTGYVSMDSIPKYTGALRDFCPGCFRCCAHCSHRCLLHT